MPDNSRVYRCLQDMYERYSAYSKVRFLRFENNLYQFIGARRKGIILLHLYHCEEEQHYILVHLRYHLPVLIKAFYSIDEIQLSSL